jgi:hypothetical protein
MTPEPPVDHEERLRSGLRTIGAAIENHDTPFGAERRRTRRPPRPFALATGAAAALVLVVGGAVALRVNKGTEEVTTGNATPSTVIDARSDLDAAVEQLRSLDRQRIEACAKQDAAALADGKAAIPTEDVPPIEVLMEGPIQVGGGPDCESGFVDPIVLAMDPASDELHPIRTADGTTIIGYWLNGPGWIPTDIVDSDNFDVELWRQAHETLAAGDTETDGPGPTGN